jgi:hypothetical protein
LVVAAALATEFDRWLCPGEIGIAICVGGAVYIFDKARQLEIAEANWQRRRVQAIAKAGPQAQEP